MRERPTEFEDLKSALNHISERFTLPVQRFITETTLLKDSLRQRQFTPSDFAVPHNTRGKATGAVQIGLTLPEDSGMGMREREDR